MPHKLSGFKMALLQNLRERIRGRIFSEMIRIQARKSELRAESRSYRPNPFKLTRADPQNPNRPEKGPEWGLVASTETPPPKAFLNQPNTYPKAIFIRPGRLFSDFLGFRRVRRARMVLWLARAFSDLSWF